jgi:hypothetical protein
VKLLFCRICGDVVKLERRKRSCRCRDVHGRYEQDGAHATVSQRAIVIGLGNGNLQEAVQAFERCDPDPGHRTLSAWVMGSDAPRVTWEGRK